MQEHDDGAQAGPQEERSVIGFPPTRLEIGARYRVTIPEGTERMPSLQWLVAAGPSASVPKSHGLRQGDVLIYQGSRHGWGHDDVHYDVFQLEGTDIQGEFWPNFYGRATRGFLQQVDATPDSYYVNGLNHMICASDYDSDEESRVKDYSLYDREDARYIMIIFDDGTRARLSITLLRERCPACQEEVLDELGRCFHCDYRKEGRQR